MKKLFPNETIYESKYFIVGQDWEIAIPGFYIVSPKRKLKSILDFSETEAKDYIKTIRIVRKAMKEALKIKEVYFFQNEDTPHGFHLWMLPYYKWMEKVAGRGPGILVSVWKYARDNLSTEKEIKKTKKAAEKVRKFISSK